MRVSWVQRTKHPPRTDMSVGETNKWVCDIVVTLWTKDVKRKRAEKAGCYGWHGRAWSSWGHSKHTGRQQGAAMRRLICGEGVLKAEGQHVHPRLEDDWRSQRTLRPMVGPSGGRGWRQKGVRFPPEGDGRQQRTVRGAWCYLKPVSKAHAGYCMGNALRGARVEVTNTQNAASSRKGFPRPEMGSYSFSGAPTPSGYFARARPGSRCFRAPHLHKLLPDIHSLPNSFYNCSHFLRRAWRTVHASGPWSEPFPPAPWLLARLSPSPSRLSVPRGQGYVITSFVSTTHA